MNRILPIVLVGGLLSCSGQLYSSAFISASGNNPELITHPSGYLGTGGDLVVEICIATDSEAQDVMQISLENSIFIWNQLEPVSPNIFSGDNNNIPSGEIDFESVLVHEIGHCIGLAHVNAATESSLLGEDRNYTKSDRGPNAKWNIDPGMDNIRGSADDLRGDDVNLHWFELGSNNPFILGDIIDGTTYSRDLDDLPDGDLFAVNADRTVSVELGFDGSEAVMQQGAFFDEDQRQLAASDVAGIRLGMSGIDRMEGTDDDYRPQFVFGGISDSCDITVQVTGTSFAFCSVGTTQVGANPNHRRVSGATAQMGSVSNFNWFFNDQSVAPGEVFSDGFEDFDG